MKVLILDDVDPVRIRLADALGVIDNLEVSSFAPGRGEVIQHILDLKPDVIVIDLHVSGALALVRTIKSGTHPPVVITLSTASSIQYRAACHRAGAEYFFDKVHEQERLVEAVADLQKELA